jgi:hypothetical protein
MKNAIIRFGVYLLAAVSFGLGFTSCGDDDMGNPTGNQTVFNLAEKENSGVSGVVAFIELDNGTVLVRINAIGTTAGNSHPVHVHFNNWVDTGDIAIMLNDIDGATGTSETVIRTTTENVRLRYADLENFNGYVNVHKSMAELEVEIAQVDIGQNALNGEEETYGLEGQTLAALDGSITLCKRKNNQTLVRISFDETIASTGAVPFLYSGSLDSEGQQKMALGTFNAQGKAFANVTTLDATPFTYADFTNYNGHIRVVDGAEVLLSAGNIGSNAN